MVTIDVNDMQREFPHYMNRVNAGETLLISQGGMPIAEVKPLARATQQLRPIGLCVGEITVPDDFDDPLPEDILVEFEGP